MLNHRSLANQTTLVGISKSKKADFTEKSLEEDASKPLIYDEFDALCLKQNEGQPVLEFESLDAALDEFYAKVSLS